MLVVNLWGAPGCGKSTAAAYIFSQLKSLGCNVELVTEFAKDLTWEGRTGALHTQLYVSGVQAQRLARIRDKVDVAIVDSPLPSGLAYVNEEERDLLNDVLWHEYNKYNNINFFLERAHPYSSDGRNQTEEEADKIGEKILAMLNGNDVYHTTSDTAGCEYIILKILRCLQKEQSQNGDSEN